MEQEEVYVVREVREESEEAPVSVQGRCKRTGFSAIVAAYALQREVETIGYARVEASCSVDGGGAVNSVAGKYDRASDGVPEICCAIFEPRTRRRVVIASLERVNLPRYDSCRRYAFSDVVRVNFWPEGSRLLQSLLRYSRSVGLYRSGSFPAGVSS